MHWHLRDLQQQQQQQQCTSIMMGFGELHDWLAVERVRIGDMVLLIAVYVAGTVGGTENHVRTSKAVKGRRCKSGRNAQQTTALDESYF